MNLFKRHPVVPLILAVFCLALIGGCITGGVKLPPSEGSPVKAQKSLRVYASWPHYKKTGVTLEEGDVFTLIVAGRIRTYPRKYPNRWEGPVNRLYTLIGDAYHDWYLFNGTNVARSGGEILFYVKDGNFNVYQGKPYDPEYYKDNDGSFKVTIIVWKDKDPEAIRTYLQAMAALNPDNEAVQSTYAHSAVFKEYYLARVETEKEVAKTRAQLGQLKEETRREKPSSGASVVDKMGAGALAGALQPGDKDAQIALLEEKLEKLVTSLAQLEDVQKQLEAEREKSARLTQELESRKDLGQAPGEDRFPPYLLVASPRDGLVTSAARIKIAGVVEDDQGLQNVEILLNGRILSRDQSRGIRVSGGDPVRRHEFEASATLEMGRNTLTIRAVDTGGLVSEKTFQVLRKEQSRNIWAVVVGIDAYTRVPQLKYAVKDARAVYRLLTSDNQIPEENVTLLTNAQATLTNLRSLLGTRIKQSAGKDDMVIIYFAGHGATERDATSPDGDGLEKYLLPVDADPRDLYASALPMREISHILNRIQSERLVFIADACYSGASGGRTISIEGFRSNLSDGFLNRISSGKGRVIITASGPNEVSAEDDRLQHGVFTYYLVEGLKGRADYDKDGLVTVDEAYRYVSDAVPKATAQEQHPVKMGAVEGQLVLGIAK